MEHVGQLVKAQREYFQSGAPRSPGFRIRSLKRLYAAIAEHKQEIERALFLDLGKQETESYETEIGLVLSDIRHTIRHLPGWAKERRVPTPVHLFPGRSRIRKEPYGLALIMGPYNYPFQLLMEPLIGAIAAGNCAVLKPSELAPHTADAVKRLIEKTFQKEYVCCVDGGVEVNSELLKQRFDYIFFTGSVRVGKIVMKAAAEHLIPVTLELGGKSPVIVEKTADIRQAAYRIMWGKLINAGQTCVAPDYVLADEEIKDALLKEMERAVEKLYGENIEENRDFGRIINERHYDRLEQILERDSVYQVFVYGRDKEKRYIGPAVLDLGKAAALDEKEREMPASMQEELFGPILPVLTYRTLKEAAAFIGRREHPLALYIFTKNKAAKEWILRHTQSGGVAVNDTVSHLVGANLPFGGVGYSGMGNYHGRYSFETFTHERSIYKKPAGRVPAPGYPPYTKAQKKFLERILR